MLAGIKMVILVSVERTEISVEKSSVTFCSFPVSVCVSIYACRNQNGDSSICGMYTELFVKTINAFFLSIFLSIYVCVFMLAGIKTVIQVSVECTKQVQQCISYSA